MRRAGVPSPLSRRFLLPSVLAAAVLVTPPAPTPVPPFASAQWSTTVTMDGARPGVPYQVAEVWLAGPRIRMVEKGKGTEKTILVKTGNDVYVWTDGQTTGLKMVYGLALKSGHVWPDYALRVAEIRANGHRVGTEKVDGYACDVFELEKPGESKGTYWLAAKLHDFPVKAVIVRSVALPYRKEADRTVTMRYHNTNVRIPGALSEAEITVPSGIEFADAAQLMLRSRPPRH